MAPAKGTERAAAAAFAGRLLPLELPRRLEQPLDVEPRGLLRAVEAQQPLLVDRRVRMRVAAVPVRPHAELLQRPVERAAQPRLGAVHAEVEVHEVPLVLERPLLLDGTRAVGLGAELGDE